MKILFFISISRAQFFAVRENVSSVAVYTRACNLSLHLCVPSTRLLAKRHGQHVVHVYTWLSEKRAEKRETGMENGGEVQRENPLPQITRLGLLFIVGNFCSHREGASDRRDRRMICALDTLSNPRGRSMRRHTACPRSQFEFLCFVIFFSFFLSSSFGKEMRAKRDENRATILRDKNNYAYVCEKRDIDIRFDALSETEKAIRRARNATYRKNGVPLGERNDPRVVHSPRFICFLTFSDIQLPRYEILCGEPVAKT